MDIAPRDNAFSYRLAVVLQSTVLALLQSFSSVVLHVGEFHVLASSFLGPILALLYFYVLRDYNLKAVFHYLHQGLVALYGFSISVYILISLPTASFIRDTGVYNLVFSDLPEKFFATTLPYFLCFYAPTILKTTLGSRETSLYCNAMIAMLGGMGFLGLHVFLLQINIHVVAFPKLELLMLMLLYVIVLLPVIAWLCRHGESKALQSIDSLPIYLLNMSLVIMLSSLACEYRLFSWHHKYLLTASGVFFPMVLMICNIYVERFSMRDNLFMLVSLIVAPFAYDCISWLMLRQINGAAMLSTWFLLMLPRRSMACASSLLMVFVMNYMLIVGLRNMFRGPLSFVRFLLANTMAVSVLCALNYTILYTGVYAYEQIIELVLNGWIYKMFMCILLAPVAIMIVDYISKYKKTGSIEEASSPLSSSANQ